MFSTCWPTAAARRRTSSTSVPVAPRNTGAVVSSAWAVPSCGSCTTNERSECVKSAARSASAWCPITSVVERGRKRGRRGQDVLDHRHARHAMQHLRPRGLHPRAFARRQDDNVKIGHGPDEDPGGLPPTAQGPIIARNAGGQGGGVRGEGSTGLRARPGTPHRRARDRGRGRFLASARFSGLMAIARSTCATASANSPRCACATASM